MKRALVVLLAVCCCNVAMAHKLAPSLLKLTETGPSVYDVEFKTPAVVTAGGSPQPVLPSSCVAQTDPVARREDTAMIVTWTVSCDGDIAGKTVRVAGLNDAGTATLFHLERSDGSELRHLLTADEPALLLPERDAAQGTLKTFVSFGVQHILSGLDHLAFVLGLLLLVNGARQLIVTITMFTVGHSITLSLAALGFIRYPVSLLELAIAASIFVLAIELSRPAEETRATWMRRRSGLMAGIFGLLHGMGFAGALGELNLPVTDTVWALFGFNLGIEVGQLAFVAVVCLVAALLRRQALLSPVYLRTAAVYFIGTFAAYWCIKRAVELIA